MVNRGIEVVYTFFLINGSISYSYRRISDPFQDRAKSYGNEPQHLAQVEVIAIKASSQVDLYEL